MKNLELSQKTQPHTGLAGYIKAVIPPTGTVVVQLASGSRILDVGTAIFLRNDISQGGSCKKYHEIGFVSDIFGSVLEPMYSLQMKQTVTGESLKMDAEVFYLHEHPSTRYISVVRDAENRYTVMQEWRLLKLLICFLLSKNLFYMILYGFFLIMYAVYWCATAEINLFILSMRLKIIWVFFNLVCYVFYYELVNKLQV